MITALASLATGRPVKSSVGMTGEVTLQGKVLPIGGVKQKLLAAHRAGLTEVIIPKRNEPDLDDLPESVRGAAARCTRCADVADVLALALEPGPGHRLTGFVRLPQGVPDRGRPVGVSGAARVVSWLLSEGGDPHDPNDLCVSALRTAMTRPGARAR